MKKISKKIMSTLMAFMLLLTLIHIGTPATAAAEKTKIPDGTYPVSFNYLRDNTEIISAADQFIEKNTGQLIIHNGQATFEHKVKSSFHPTFSFFGIRNTGASKAIINGQSVTGKDGYTSAVIKQAENPGFVTYQFAIEDIWSKQDILMHINDENNIFGLPEIYNNWYNTQLELRVDLIDFSTPPKNDDDTDDNLLVSLELFNERVAAGQNLYENSQEGDSDGLYPPGSRQQLQDSIITAENLVATNSGSEELLKAAYTIVDQAIKKFKSLQIVVDKSKLIEWITEATSWLEDAKDGGETETGIPSNPLFVPVTAGEYPVDTSTIPPSGSAQKALLAIAEAQALVNNPLATQLEVNALYLTLKTSFKWEDLNKKRYVAVPATLLILDSVEDNAQLSTIANEISTSATIIQSKEDPYYEGFANITFIDPENKLNVSDIKSAAPDARTGSFAIRASSGEPSFSSTARPLVTAASTENNKTFQVPVRSHNPDNLQTDEKWQGFTVLRYSESATPSERKIVYISFNGDQLNELNQLITEAQQFHNQAVAGAEPGKYPAVEKTKLQEAINSAKIVGEKLASPRPAILTATKDLKLAFETFKNAQITGTPTNPNPGPGSGSGPGSPGNTANPVYPADGSYLMSYRILKDGTNETSIASTYVVNTALVTVSGGSKTVSFTVKRSAEITGLTLNGSSGSITESDTENNTRVVTFTLSDLSSKIDAWVKVDWASIGYHHEYDIQFKFDESSARFAGANPSVPGGNGNTGAPPGLELPGTEAGKPDGENDDESEAEKEEDSKGKDNKAKDNDGKKKDNDQNGTGVNKKPVSFKDIEKHWAKEKIAQAVQLGIVSGYSDNSFRPDGLVTRGEFAVMISKALKLKDNAEAEKANFHDSKNIPSWAQEHIARAVANGIISGFEDQTFRADDQLTRAQLAVIIARAANLELNNNLPLNFADAASIPSWAQKGVSAAVKAGLIQGKNNNKFDPLATATRAEALTLILRLLEAK